MKLAQLAPGYNYQEASLEELFANDEGPSLLVRIENWPAEIEDLSAEIIVAILIVAAGYYIYRLTKPKSTNKKTP